MTKTAVIKESSIQIPCQCMKYGYTCFDCRYLSYSDVNRYGERWCGSFSRYVDPTQKACSRRA